MRLGLTNRIVDDLDFKVVDFDRRLRSDSKSNHESESTIAIWFRYKIDLFPYKIDLFPYKIDLFRSKFDLFWLEDRKRLSKCRLINRKWWIISKTTIFIENNHFRSNSTNCRYKSNYFPYKSNYFRCKWSGFESSRRFRWISLTISDRKSQD